MATTLAAIGKKHVAAGYARLDLKPTRSEIGASPLSLLFQRRTVHGPGLLFGQRVVHQHGMRTVAFGHDLR